MNFTRLIAMAIPFVMLSSCCKTDCKDVAIQNIMTRTSVREYLDKPVPDEDVKTLLRAAMAAPSAVNKQPWHFVVINQKNVLKAIADSCPNASMAANAPLAIMVCGNMNKALDGNGKDFWIQDASAATQNILLAANALGLGAVWTGIYPEMSRVKALSSLMNLPENLIPLAVIPVGYPAGENKPKDKWNEENVTYGVFSDSLSDKLAVKPEQKLKPFAPQLRFRQNPFTLFGKDWMLLAAGDSSKFNAMTIGWGEIGNLWGLERNVITVYVRTNRYTNEFMTNNKYFTVSTFSEDFRDKLNYMGSHSGRNEDKIKNSGLEVVFSELGNPIFSQANMVFECKKLYSQIINVNDIDPECRSFYKDGDAPHVMYIGEIVNAWNK